MRPKRMLGSLFISNCSYQANKGSSRENPDSKILELVEGDLSKINAKTAFDAAKMGDKTGIEVVDNYITYLAEGLANMVNIFQPGIIAIGGGVSKEGEYLLKPLRKNEKHNLLSYGLEEGRIVTAKMGNDAGIVGAAFIPRYSILSYLQKKGFSQMERKIKLTIEYDGSQYHGWQFQKMHYRFRRYFLRLSKNYGRGNNPRRAGRTDRGVHALGQVAILLQKPEYRQKNLCRHLILICPMMWL